jgi:class 3 adenylate cyclase/tetratricopeptide (TPR) repeat protein
MEGVRMKCPKCKFDNREGVKFCEECGTKFELKCPKCKAAIPFSRKFCGECGHKLFEPSEIPFIDYSEPKSYTPKFIADKILTSRSSIEGERKLVTVLFGDVANYTSIAERLDPEDVHQIMDGCLKILMDEIHQHEGTVNQFTGDGVMALFGAPVSHEDHAERACYTALSIQRALKNYSEKIKHDYGVSFYMRIGLNSGPVVVGSIGDDLRMDYTAVGDTTNLAARMQSIADSGTILVSKNTYRLAKDFFEFDSLGKIEIKGKEQPQETYKLIRTGEIETRIKASVAKGLTKFVGRKNSMAALKEPWEKVLSGSGQVVGIVGEAGVGKSRLLLEFIRQLSKDDYTYLEGRCLHYGNRMPYLPIIDILKAYFDIKDGDQKIRVKRKLKNIICGLDKQLTFTLPSIQELLSLEIEDEKYLNLAPGQKKILIFEAIRDLFLRESERKPLILAVEDLHWIDKISEEFISHLIDWLPNKNILLILLYRLEYTHQWESKSYYNRIGLSQLGQVSSCQLVQAILEGNKVAPELNELIISQTDGNPLFVEELTHSLLERRSIQKKNNQYVLTEKVSKIHIPGKLQGIIASRVDRIEEKHKHVMQVASVIGREFAYRLLRTIMDMPEGIKSYLLNLQRLEFILEKRLLPELEYIFKHALTQEIVYNSLLQKKRKKIHEKTGHAIETLYSGNLEEYYELLAYHYSLSDNRDKTLKFLYSACQKAIKFNAMNEAMEYFEEAMKLLDRMPDNKKNQKLRISLIVNQWPAFLMLFRFPEQYDLLNLYKHVAIKLRDQELLAEFYNRKGHIEMWFGDFDHSVENRGKAYEIFKAIENIKGTANACIGLQWNYLYKGDYNEVFEFRDKTLKLMEIQFTPYEYVYAVLGASYAYIALGRWKESLEEANNGLRIAEKFSDNSLLAVAALHVCRVYILKGDIDKAVEYGEMALQKAPTPGDKTWAQSVLAWAWIFSGKLDQAIDFWAGLAPLMKAVRYEPGAVQVMALLSEGYLSADELDKAKTTLEECVELAERYGMKLYLGRSHCLLAEAILKTEPKQAISHLKKSIEILEMINAAPYLARAYGVYGRYKCNQSQFKHAKEYFSKALSIFEHLGNLIEAEKIRVEISKLPKS